MAGILGDQQIGAMQNEDIMTQDPNSGQSLLPPAGAQDPSMGQEPEGMASQTVNFDVEKNPQDMQFMTDVAAYAPMLQAMDPEQRKEKWPGIANKLGQVSPKAKAMLDPSLPPTDADLKAITGKLPESTYKAPPERYKPLKADEIQMFSPEDPGFEEQNMRLMSDMASVGDWGDDGEEKLKAKYFDKGYRYYKDENGKPHWDEIPDHPATLERKAKLDKPASADSAAKISAMETVSANLPLLKKAVFNLDEGTVNKDAVFQATVADQGVLGRLAASKDGNRLKTIYTANRVNFAYAISGATFKDEEAIRFAQQFEIQNGDPDDVAIQKYLNQEMFVNKYLSITSKSGKDAIREADFYNARARTYVTQYRERWITDAKKKFPNESVETLNRAFNKKILTDPNFVKDMSVYAKEKKWGDK